MHKGPAALGCRRTVCRRLVLGGLIACSAIRAELPLAHLDVDDGLSHNSVFAIAQDRDGFIWLGTADGLNRFDGYEFRVYRHSGDDGLLGNSVTSLLVDNAGRLWVGTERGINRYEPEHDRFAHYRLGPDGPAGGPNPVTVLHQDRDGTLRVGTAAGTFVYRPSVERFEREPGITGRRELAVVDLDQAPDGSIWTLLRQGENRLIVRQNGPAARPDVFTRTVEWGDPWAFVFDAAGRLWLDTATPRPPGADPRVPPDPLTAPRVTAATKLLDGQLWFGTESGLVIVDPERGDRRYETLDPVDRSWLRNYVRAIFEDADGSVWIGSYAGVYRHDPGARPFRALRHDPTDPATLGGSAVSSIVGGPDHIWVGTFGGGISLLDQAGQAIAHFRHDPTDPASLPDDVVWHLTREDSTLWIGTLRGLARLDLRTRAITRIPTIPEITVFYLARANDGALWLATNRGLFRAGPAADGGIGRPTRVVPGPATVAGNLPANGFNPIILWFDRRREQLWIGTEEALLYRLDTANRRFTPVALSEDDPSALPGEGIWDLRPDGRGGLWVAHGAGLSHVELHGGTARHYGIRSGLPGSVVYSVAVDRRDGLWLGTNRGLARFDPATGRVVRTYSRADGLPFMEFNRHARWRDAAGRLYFGGTDGIVRFDPEQVRPNLRAPRVVVTGLSRLGAERVEPINPNGLERLVLEPGDYGFSVRFAALSFVNPRQNRHAYRLLGLESDWVPASGSRTARYTSLPPGRYTLQLRGSNNDGLWSTAPASLEIEVVPAFRQTVWFPLSLAAGVALLVVIAWRLRVAQLRRLEQVRLAIAADLHDDLSADLGGIGVAAEMLAGRRETDDEERELLVEMARSARESGSALRDLIWYINPDLDTLDALAQRLRTIAAIMLQRHDVTTRAKIEDGARKLPMMTRRAIVLICKEALHNIVRHAAAEAIAIRIQQRGDWLQVVIIDDGKGFDPECAGDGLGIGNMRRRATAIGGEIRIDSRPGAGTRIELGVPLTQIRDGLRARFRARFRQLVARKRRS